MNFDELYSKVEELREYAEYEGSELGELNNQLCNLVGGILDYASEEFQQSVYNEIDEQLKYFKENTKIVEDDVVISHKVKELIYINE